MNSACPASSKYLPKNSRWISSGKELMEESSGTHWQSSQPTVKPWTCAEPVPRRWAVEHIEPRHSGLSWGQTQCPLMDLICERPCPVGQSPALAVGAAEAGSELCTTRTAATPATKATCLQSGVIAGQVWRCGKLAADVSGCVSFHLSEQSANCAMACESLVTSGAAAARSIHLATPSTTYFPESTVQGPARSMCPLIMI